MTLLLCALMACCVNTTPVSSQAGCGPTGSAIATAVTPSSVVPEQPVLSGKCGGAAIPGRGSAPADNEWVPFQDTIWYHGQAFVFRDGIWIKACFPFRVDECPIHGWKYPMPEGAIAGCPTTVGTYELRCEVDTIVPPLYLCYGWRESKLLAEGVYDTTCAWVRHECTGAMSLSDWQTLDALVDSLFWSHGMKR